MSKQRIFIAGHKGMVGSAILRHLRDFEIEIITKDRKQLDLLKQEEVRIFFRDEKIDQVYLASAKVGGIHANNFYPAEFIYENLMIQSNIIKCCFETKVQKLLFLGSSCVYPVKNRWALAYKGKYITSYETEKEAREALERYREDPDSFIKPQKKVGCVRFNKNSWQLTCKHKYLGSYPTKEEAEEAREALQSSL